jgi:DNA-binding Xre family transcriptional regulator
MRTRLKVREVANEKHISLTKLSQRSEVAYNTVRRVWRDPFTDVTLSTMQRLADVLGVDVRELIESVPDENQAKMGDQW